MSTGNSSNTAPIGPRPVVAGLPHYAAGKAPLPVPGLQSYKLSSNENPLPPLPAVLEAIAAQTAVNRYPDPQSAVLCQAVADHLGVPFADVVAGAGSLGALNQILAAFAGQNEDGSQDEVLYAWRSFEAYPISVGLSGARSVQVPLRPDGTHDLAAMAAAVTPRTKVVLLCTPNNPTGPALDAAQTEDFIAALPSGVLVVVDEAYREFVRSDSAVDGLELYRRHPNVVLLRTFSKAHGLAGLRVGYSLSRPGVSEHLRAAAVPFAVSTVAAHAAAASLAHVAEVVERVQSLVAERTKVVAGLAGLGWDIPDAQGNFVWLPLGVDSAGFAALAGEHGLSVRAFAGEGVRVTIGEPEANARFLALCASSTKVPRRS
ncbi:histidinol-phosphate transaminase [Arthrobacter sp. 35W]|uniref:histidinol-phosphate transaminase n=1 Tax=Arthrobacter sp. 35W TaxID=1132441 RepID=UPI0003FD4450|nr:histidinol-phosphate transaminase [Arthrobacter sp. 35W]